MRVHVKFFAILREMTGIKDEWTEIGMGTTVEQLWSKYAGNSPRVGTIRAAYAINQRLAKPDQVLVEGDEVGFLPPVSGGAVTGRTTKRRAAKGKRKAATTTRRTRVASKAPARKPRAARARPSARLTGDASIMPGKLNLAALVQRVEFPGAGAILVFSGVVRDNSKGKSVGYLEYEAYPEMAQATLNDILAECKSRWADVRVALAHRTGKVNVGESSLVIAVAAPHRAEAYAASRYAIERVKAILPVWKKEFATDGEYWVEGPVAGELPPEQADDIVRDAEYAPF